MVHFCVCTTNNDHHFLLKQLTNVKIGLMALVKNHLSLNRISPKTNLIHLIGDTFLLRILCESLPLVNYASQLLRPKFNNLKKVLSNGHLGLRAHCFFGIATV